MGSEVQEDKIEKGKIECDGKIARLGAFASYYRGNAEVGKRNPRVVAATILANSENNILTIMSNPNKVALSVRLDEVMEVIAELYGKIAESRENNQQRQDIHPEG